MKSGTRGLARMVHQFGAGLRERFATERGGIGQVGGLGDVELRNNCAERHAVVGSACRSAASTAARLREVRMVVPSLFIR